MYRKETQISYLKLVLGFNFSQLNKNQGNGDVGKGLQGKCRFPVGSSSN